VKVSGTALVYFLLLYIAAYTYIYRARILKDFEITVGLKVRVQGFQISLQRF
jgi:hypothetical protein